MFVSFAPTLTSFTSMIAERTASLLTAGSKRPRNASVIARSDAAALTCPNQQHTCIGLIRHVNQQGFSCLTRDIAASKDTLDQSRGCSVDGFGPLESLLPSKIVTAATSAPSFPRSTVAAVKFIGRFPMRFARYGRSALSQLSRRSTRVFTKLRVLLNRHCVLAANALTRTGDWALSLFALSIAAKRRGYL